MYHSGGAVNRGEGCVHREVKSERESLYFPVKLSASLKFLL